MLRPVYTQSVPTSWRDQYRNLKDAQREYNQYQSLMSQYEQAVIYHDIVTRKEQNKSAITQGAVGEYNAHLALVKNATEGVERARRAEINSWDSSRLTTEMQAAEMRLRQTVKFVQTTALSDQDTERAMKQLYDEAQASGDRYKQRAAAEIFRNAVQVSGLSGERAMRINHIAQQAERDLANLRVSDGMKQAEQERATRIQECLNARHELLEVGEFVDGYPPDHPFAQGPFAIAARRLRQDETGEFQVYPENAPEVTGFYPSEVEK